MVAGNEADTADHGGGWGPGSSRVDTGVAAVFAIAAGAFLYWSFGYTELDRPIILTLAVVFGLFMAFNIGGNDVANSFGTSVGSGTLSVKQALLVAAVFEVSGAVIAGGAVTDTVRDGIVNLDNLAVQPMDFVFIMMSALIAAALWLLFASSRGLPVSTTHSIIGAIVGSSIVLGMITSGSGTALSLVQWGKVSQIAASWVLSPLLGGIVSYLLFREVKKHVLGYNDHAEERLQEIRQEKRARIQDHKQRFERLDELQQISYTHAMARDMHMIGDRDFAPEDLESDYWRDMLEIDRRRESLKPHMALERMVPPVAAAGAGVIGVMLLVKSLGEVGAGLSLLEKGLILVLIAAVAWLGTYALARSLHSAELKRATFVMFSWMQVFTAAGFAFSHGSNDIANAIGPFAAILDVLRTDEVGQSAPVPTIAMIVFGVALCAGLWFIGRNVIQTVGHNLTKIHPASGFSAELSAIAVILLATTLGLPVSSTHILIGAVLGIGLVNAQANWALMRPIAVAWIVTLPAAAAISALSFVVLRAVL